MTTKTWLLTVLTVLILSAGIVSAATPTMDSASIQPITAHTNDTLRITVNASDSDTSNVMYECRIYRNGALNMSLNKSLSVNIQNPGYSHSGSWSGGGYGDPRNIFDNDYGTWAEGQSNPSIINETYNITNYRYPINGTWTYKFTYNSPRTDPIPWSCLSAYPLSLIFQMRAYRTPATGYGKGYSVFLCDESGSFATVHNSSPAANYETYIFDDEINLTYKRQFPESSAKNIFNISTQTTVPGEIWMASCRAFDGTSYTSWMNTSVSSVHNDPPIVASVTVNPSGGQSDQDLSFTNTTTDLENNTISSSNILWYKNGVRQTALDNASIIVSGNTSVGQAWVVGLRVFDGTNWSSLTNSSTMVIGDNVSPSLSAARLSAVSGMNDASFTAYVNVSEINQLVWVYVEIEDPNGVKMNYSMSPGTSSGEQSKTYTPSTDGTYHFFFYAKDGSGNRGVLNASMSYYETTWIPPPSGSSSITLQIDPDEPKTACDIQVSPISVEFRPDHLVQEITLRNEDDASYEPAFALTGALKDALKITNPINTLLPGKSDSFGIKYDPDTNFTEGDAVLVLMSENCADINITINAVKGTEAVIISTDLFFGGMSLIDLLSEPVFAPGTSLREKTPIFTVGALTLLMFAAWTAALWGLIRKNYAEQSYGVVTAWFLFGLALTWVCVIFIVTAIRVSA